jgi:hypothetical protein
MIGGVRRRVTSAALNRTRVSVLLTLQHAKIVTRSATACSLLQA